jgi:hypothetical protein
MADVDFRVKNGLIVDNGSISLTNTTSTSIAVGTVSLNATGFYVGNTSIVGNQLTLGARLLANGGTGTAGQVLTSGDATTNAYWATPSVVAGSNTQVQFNDSGSLGGSAGFVFNKTSNTLTVSNTVSVGNSTINSQSNATMVRVANTLYSTNVIPGGITTRDGYFTSTFFIGNSAATADAKVEGSVTIGSNDIYFAVGSLAGQHITLYANGTGPSLKAVNGLVTTEIKPGNLTLGGTITANGSTGTAGYMLMSAGSGANVYWTTAPSGVAGSNTQIQYNNSGSLAGSAALTFNNTTNNISVANSATISGSLGIGTAPSGTAGEIRATNNITAYYSSDARLKENVRPITNALEDLFKLRGVRFDWTDDYIQKSGGEDGYFIRKQDVGIIAQELEAVLPELVIDREDGFKAVKYDRIVALLIEAVKELKFEVDFLKQK